MNDLIRREDAIEVAYQLRRKPNDDEWDWWLRSFNAIPSADRPQGEWIETNNGRDTTCECSACHYKDFIPNYQVGSEFVCINRYWFERDFCPICGAEMKGADDES